MTLEFVEIYTEGRTWYARSAVYNDDWFNLEWREGASACAWMRWIYMNIIFEWFWCHFDRPVSEKWARHKWIVHFLACSGIGRKQKISLLFCPMNWKYQQPNFKIINITPRESRGTSLPVSEAGIAEKQQFQIDGMCGAFLKHQI